MHLLHRLPAHRRRVAVVADGCSHRYGELLDAAEAIAGGLMRDQGGAPLCEARVAFRATPGFGTVATLLGVWYAGGVAVPLAVGHPAAELEHTLRDSDPVQVLAEPGEDALRAVAAGLGLATTSWRQLAAAPPVSGLPRPPGSARALILYTSGSTGRPKGVVHSHDGLAAQMRSLVAAWGWCAEDRILNVLPLHHVHGLINVLGCALWAGARWETLPAFDPEAVWRAFRRHRPPTLFMAVPTIYHRLLDHWQAQSPTARSRATRAAARLRLMVSGSAALPVPLLEAWHQATGHTLLERYGMTEIGMALSNLLEGERRPGCVGRPLPGVEVRLVDETGAVVPSAKPGESSQHGKMSARWKTSEPGKASEPGKMSEPSEPGEPGEPKQSGESGEIEVRGATVFLEYWRRPAETAAAFHDGWFRTGDLALLDQGSYCILGRLSVDIIKTGGYKVSALEVEAVLRTHPAIADCAVVALPDKAWGERLHAAVVPRPGAGAGGGSAADGDDAPTADADLDPSLALDLDSLRTWAHPLLAPYKIPRGLTLHEELPRNALGKVVKPELVRQLAAPAEE